MIISVLDKVSGFYSELFFMINHYLYARKTNQRFILWAKDWLFRSVYGWTDYFKACDTGTLQDNEEKHTFGFNQLPDNFSMWEYRDAIRNHVYLYNETTENAIKKVTEKLGLVPGKYDSIFIRRGDKLCKESQFFDTEIYLNLLLEKNPDTKFIFLQTDDYNCFIDLKRILTERNRTDIKLITLCHPEVKGMVVFDNELQVELHNCHIKGNQKNQDYFNSIQEDLKKFKPVNKMNSQEIYNHTLEMIIGVDIVLHSKFCILDNQSNVSKFISISHDILENVFDIRYPRENIQMHWTMCPSHW
jgi:hypothetical protein